MNPEALAAVLQPFVGACEHCQETLSKIKALGQDTRYHGTRRLDNGGFVEGYVLRPDRNAGGHITHWHIDIVPEKETK